MKFKYPLLYFSLPVSIFINQWHLTFYELYSLCTLCFLNHKVCYPRYIKNEKKKKKMERLFDTQHSRANCDKKLCRSTDCDLCNQHQDTWFHYICFWEPSLKAFEPVFARVPASSQHFFKSDFDPVLQEEALNQSAENFLLHREHVAMPSGNRRAESSKPWCYLLQIDLNVVSERSQSISSN